VKPYALPRWIVNPATRTVRSFLAKAPHTEPDALQPGEFLHDAPTAADAMCAGARRLIAEEALRASGSMRERFVLVGDRIEPTASATDIAACDSYALQRRLLALSYDVWAEGVALVVLARPARSAK
jgi:hypothetical protein